MLCTCQSEIKVRKATSPARKGGSLWRIRYSNSQRTGRFSSPVQTGPGAHPASYTIATGHSRGKEAGAWRLLPTLI